MAEEKGHRFILAVDENRDTHLAKAITFSYSDGLAFLVCKPMVMAKAVLHDVLAREVPVRGLPAVRRVKCDACMKAEGNKLLKD